MDFRRLERIEIWKKLEISKLIIRYSKITYIILTITEREKPSHKSFVA